MQIVSETLKAFQRESARILEIQANIQKALVDSKRANGFMPYSAFGLSSYSFGGDRTDAKSSNSTSAKSSGMKSSPKEESYISRDTWIQNIFSEYLRKHPDNALIVYRLESEFKGNYYDRDDDRFSIDAQRPYFIWLTGPSDCLQTLVNSYSLKTLSRGKTANALFLDSRDAIEVPYNIVLGSGNFRLDRRDPHAIVDARKNVRGIETNLLTFRVNVSLEALFCSEDYLLDPANYELGDRDYKLTVSRSQNPGFTHTLSFSSPIVKPSSLNVQLKKKLPSWVVQYDDPIGDGISDTLMSKTYGLAYLLKGAWAAYTLHNDTYATIRVKIN